MNAARMLHGNAPANQATQVPNASGQVAAKKAEGPGQSTELKRD